MSGGGTWESFRSPSRRVFHRGLGPSSGAGVHQPRSCRSRPAAHGAVEYSSGAWVGGNRELVARRPLAWIGPKSIMLDPTRSRLTMVRPSFPCHLRRNRVDKPYTLLVHRPQQLPVTVWGLFSFDSIGFDLRPTQSGALHNLARCSPKQLLSVCRCV